MVVSGGSDHTAQYFCYISMFQTAEQLELDHLALALLLSAELEVLGPLDGTLILPLAIRTLQPQNQLLGLLAFFLKMGLDWPPNPCCLRSYLRLPWACLDSADFLYWVTFILTCLLHLAQKVLRPLGMLTMVRLL